MATTKKKTIKRKLATEKVASLSRRQKVVAKWRRVQNRRRQFLGRRPHRSFRRTKRRDYVRSLKLPGYVSFTGEVFRTLRVHRRTFFYLILLYSLLSIFLVGLASQDTFNQLSDTLKQTGGDILSGTWGQIGGAALLLFVGASGNLSTQPSQSQQIFGALLLILLWLTTVWLLRAFLAGKKPRLRDAIYNSAAPLISTLLLFILLLVQLLPLGFALLTFAAWFTTDGAIAMLFSLGGALLVSLSFYFIVSTLMALVVITLPGMYPWQAIKTAGDLVVGRRLRLLLRFLWVFFVVIIAWAVTMIPLIIFTKWLQDAVTWTAWIPIVPLAFLILSSMTILFVASYVYLLYRKVVDDGSAPA